MMARPRRRRLGSELTEKQEAELADPQQAIWVWMFDAVYSAFPSEDAKRRAWERHGERITEEFRAEKPGRRPPGWWQFEAPRDRPVFTEDRPDDAPDDLCNESAWLWEFGELGEEERARAPGPTPAQSSSFGIPWLGWKVTRRAPQEKETTT